LRQRSKDLVDRLRAEASTGSLTGLSDRRRWQELPLEVGRARRSRAGLAVALIDLDRFKRLNDTAGRRRDQPLQAVTSVRAWGLRQAFAGAAVVVAAVEPGEVAVGREVAVVEGLCGGLGGEVGAVDVGGA
jgi:GGDEF domain-containing protein